MTDRRNIIVNTLSTSAFIPVNKALLRYLGGDATAAIVLCELIRMSESLKEYSTPIQIEELYDCFPISIKRLENNTGLTQYKQSSSLKRLEEKNLIYTIIYGFPAKRYAKINFNKIEEILNEQPVPSNRKNLKSKTEVNKFYLTLNTVLSSVSTMNEEDALKKNSPIFGEMNQDLRDTLTEIASVCNSLDIPVEFNSKNIKIISAISPLVLVRSRIKTLQIEGRLNEVTTMDKLIEILRRSFNE